MKRCIICGASDQVLEVFDYQIPVTCMDGTKRTKTACVCICCSAWGMATEEKLEELAEYSVW